ncbi:hypothetical protein [Bradyrhizobium sp.]|nr:hypothetical protein [Bradyrhizobium sp.]HZR77108.1 hypothetical protein [Bradyrhizobium sp.]
MSARQNRCFREFSPQVNFYTRQFVDAFSPSNFVATDPEVLAMTVAAE